jgi:hypothetical protein
MIVLMLIRLILTIITFFVCFFFEIVKYEENLTRIKLFNVFYFKVLTKKN